MEAATGQEVELCLECIEWAKVEKRTFLRQALEVRPLQDTNLLLNVPINKLHCAHLDIHLDFYHLDHSLSSLKLKNAIFLPLNVPFETYPVVSALDTTWCLFE